MNENYYHELLEEQRETNAYLSNIDSNVETIMQNNTFYHESVNNNFGVIGSECIIFIALILCLIAIN